MAAPSDTIARPAFADGMTCRIFVAFLPISDDDRELCGFGCGSRAEQAERVGTWGVAFTCRQHRLEDPET